MSGLGGNCLLMAFSALAPLAGTLTQDALEASVEGGLISETTFARNFCKRPLRGKQKVLYRINATFHEPTVGGAPEGPSKSMRKVA
jgi:hypothetical protein